jgi:hypothetical protein
MFRSAWPIALVLALLSTPAVAQSSSIRAACESDHAKLCPDVTPGRAAISTCLMSHKEQLSVGCRQALEARKKTPDAGQDARPTPAEQGQKGSRQPSGEKKVRPE